MAKIEKDNQGPKVLIFDIETSPLEVYSWGIWDQKIGLNQVKEDWSVLSYSAKWLEPGPYAKDDRNVVYHDTKKMKNIRDDKQLLKGIWKLLDEADVVITQNGKSFDVPKLNARFAIHGMKSPSSFQHWDTKRLSKKHFAFTSHGLEYMTSNLCKKYKKLNHKKFPGQALWTECLAGNKEAWKEMEIYNKHDVLSLEELFHILAPWNPSVNFDVFTDTLTHVCSCGHKEFENKGYAYTSAGKFHRYKCKQCGKESRGKQNLLSREKRRSMRK